MSILIRGMEMPKDCLKCPFCLFAGGYWKCLVDGSHADFGGTCRPQNCPLIPVPPHGRLRRRIVYRGEVYNALESARINALDGILTDRYKDGFHDGLKKALEILANEVKDAPTIIPASEEGE